MFAYNLEMTVGLTSAAGDSWIFVLGFVQCGEDLCREGNKMN